MQTTTVTLNGVPLEVDYSYFPPRRGYRNSFGAPEEPDEPAEFDIEEIRCGGWEILCMMDDDKIDEVRDLIIRRG